MSRGIYITANDNVTEQAIALMKSIREYDAETPVSLIPYNDNYKACASLLGENYGVTVYQDLELIDRLSKKLVDIFGQDFFARPNVLRKLACWLGEFDEFLYIDTDIVVFEKIIDNLDYLQDHDFLCYDYQHKGGLTNVFTPKVIEDGVFNESQIQDVFNSGWWASKKNLFSEQDLYDTLSECTAHPEYLDFSQKTSDQPILNYIVFRRIPRSLNIVREPGKEAGSWGGSPNFAQQGNILVDTKHNNLPLAYIHWAGIKIKPGCPYWDVWKHYRYLNETAPEDPPLPKPPSLWQRGVNKIKKIIGSK